MKSLIKELEEEIKQLRAALEDITRQPEGDEQSAQAVAREALKTIKDVSKHWWKEV